MVIQKRYFGPLAFDARALENLFEVEPLLSAIRKGVESYQLGIVRGSKNLQDSISLSLDDEGVNLSFKFQPFGMKSQANYQLDFVHSKNKDGLALHIGGELAFDNRQVIFTNVIKVDLAMKRLRDASIESDSLAVLVTFCSESRGLAGWDGSVATFEEYSQQLEWGLESYLTGPLLLVGLGRVNKGAN